MRNLVDERPTRDLHGRLAWTRSFVRSEDLNGRDVLDVGCGFGWFALLALDTGAASVTGVEPTEEALSTVRAHFDQGACTFQVASAVDLPFPAESFDTVVCWEVLEHIPKRTEQRAFDEMRRVLRPGGAFYLSTPHAAPLAVATDPAWWLQGHRHYSRAALAAFARNAGFAVEFLETRGGTWEIAQMLNLYVSKWILRRRPLLQSTFTKHLDEEWSRPGFTTLFLRCRKPHAAGN